MSAENPDSQDRFWESLDAAVSDLRSAQSGLHEAQRLGNKYDIDGRSVVSESLSRVNDVAEDLARLLSDRDRGGSSCFPGTALVSTPAGPRPIASIRQGDHVLSWSPRTSTTTVRAVTAVQAHGPHVLWRVRLAGGGGLAVTPNHRMFTSRGWIRVDRLRAGDALVRLNSGARGATVVAVEPTARVEPVFNLVTAGEHSYIVDGLVAHNFTHLRSLRTWWHRLVLDGRAVVPLLGHVPGHRAPTGPPMKVKVRLAPSRAGRAVS